MECDEFSFGETLLVKFSKYHMDGKISSNLNIKNREIVNLLQTVITP